MALFIEVIIGIQHPRAVGRNNNERHTHRCELALALRGAFPDAEVAVLDGIGGQAWSIETTLDNGGAPLPPQTSAAILRLIEESAPPPKKKRRA